MKYTVGSLYAGVGGICLGFKNAGFDISWANEFDKNACITYRENFKHQLIEGDIMNIDIENLPKIDILTAGFPCQPFSVAGYRKGFDDNRGNHFFKILDFIDLMRPKVVFLENVKNLVGHDKGNTFKTIKDLITERDYSFQSKVLNTKDYGNIPHNRERIFMVCFDKRQSNEAELNFDFPTKEPLKRSINEIILNSKVDDKYYYTTEKNQKIYSVLKNEVVKNTTIYQWRRHYVRENKSNVSPTLTANMGTGGHNVPIVLTDFGIRKLTPEECFTLQGFPLFNKTYKLPNVASAHLYKQAGNSVSVPVIESIAKNIFKTLRGESCKEKELTLF